jgi:RHS repeat-associated protein
MCVAGSGSRSSRRRFWRPTRVRRASILPASSLAGAQTDLRRFGSRRLRLLHLVCALAALQLVCVCLASGAVDLLADKNGDFRGPTCPVPPFTHADPDRWTGAGWYNDDGDYPNACALALLGEQFSAHDVSVVSDPSGPAGFEQYPAARIVWDGSGINGMTMTGTNTITATASDIFYVDFWVKCPPGAGLKAILYSGQGTAIQIFAGTGVCTGAWVYVTAQASSVVSRNFTHITFRESGNSNVDGQIYLIKWVRLFKNLPGGLFPPHEVVPSQPPEQTWGTCDGAGIHALAPSACTADPVNSLTGAFTTSETDLSMPATGVSFALTRSYTSADTSSGRLGTGWTDNYAAALAIQPNGDALLHGDEGQRLLYTKKPDGSFLGAAGARSSLTAIAGGYKLVSHDQLTYQFDSNGVLQSVKERNGQGLTLGYDGQGRLATITDAVSRTVTLAYNASNLLSSVSTPDGRTVTYGYGAGLLTDVTLPDPDGGGPLAAPVTHYGYDGGNRLATIVDGNNHTQVTNVYDPSTGRVTQQTDANNKTTAFSWDPASKTATVTDANSHVWKDVYANNVLVTRIDATNKPTQFGHDSDLNTSSVTSPDAATTTSMGYDGAGNLLLATAPLSLGSVQKIFTYDAQNNVTTVRDARNKLTSYGYDPAGNNNSITLDGQPVASYGYNGQGQLLSSTDGNSKTTTYGYDANGNISSVTAPDPDGAGPLAAAVTTYTYDALGNVLTRVDPLGNCQGCTPANYTTTYSYDAEGHLLTETDPLNHTTRHTYDAVGNETGVTDANTHTTTYAYDDANRLVRMTGPDPDGAGPLTPPITTYTYDDVGNRLTVVDPRGNGPGGNPAAYTTTDTYDANNRLASETTPKGEKTTYTYDPNGNLATVVDPRGNVQGANPTQYTTSYTNDAAGRLLTTADPLGNVSTNHYDPVGNLDWTKDANTHQTSYSYDAAGRILTVTAPDGGLTTYTYDGDGNLQTRKDDNNHQTSYSYDDAGRLSQVTGPDPDGAGPLTAPVTTYAYDANGNLASMTDPNGNATPTQGDGTTANSYDRANRLAGIDYSDVTPDVTLGYDAAGNRTSMSDGSGSLTYVYDALDRLTSNTRGTNTFSYVYDLSSNLTSRTYPDSTATTYTYDEDNRLASAVSGGATTGYAYDPASNLTQTTLPSGNGYIETRAYDRAGRLYEVKNAKGASTLSDFVSTLDPVGNPTQIVQSGAVSSTQTYTYDASDRLSSVCFQAGTCPGTSDPFIRWTYDKVGNRLTQARPGVATTNYTYNGLDELTQAGSTGYSYDQNGNEKTAGSRTLGYDLANRLATTTSGSTTTTYTYDGDGNRLQASTGSQASKKTNYLWDTAGSLSQLALERDGNNALLRRYLYGARRISMRSGTSDYYFHHDALGSVRNVTSSTGATQWTDTYEPFGAIRSETKNAGGAPDNFMKFTGEYLDPTGLYYVRARQYDPTSGRFTQVDPVSFSKSATTMSDYLYAGDEPTVMVDPSGMTFVPSDSGQASAADATSPSDTDIGDLSFFSADAAGTANALTPAQRRNARIIFRLALDARLLARRGREMVAAAYMESTLNARAVNRSTGAAGLFQLLSAGYVRRAKALGGVFNPRANTCAILPDYVAYWHRHPNARPGAGAAAVEASGEGASFYAQPLAWLAHSFAPIAVPPCPR